MKNVFLSVSLLLFFMRVDAQKAGFDIWGYPVIDSVICYLSDKAPVMSVLSGGQWYDLAKKKDGWYLYTYIYDKGYEPTGPEVLCWSKKAGKYVYTDRDLDVHDTASALFKSIFIGHSARDYGREPMYGYVGWTKDVYQMLEGTKHLSDLALEALARAYSDDAVSRIGTRYGWPASADINAEQNYPGNMTQAEIDSFRKYNRLASATYLRLWHQNPKYQTFVGDIWVKYCNEVMTGYLDLTIHQGADEGSKELQGKELYDPLIISFAKNLLNSCDKNGMLIVEGDNDTYPVYYVQAKLGYRRDVLVINSTLAGTAMYINFLRKGLYEAPGIPISIPAAAYEGSKMDILRPDSSLYLVYSKVEGMEERNRPKAQLKNETVMVNMLQTNAWKRPVYFANTVSPDSYYGLAPYMVLHGMVNQVQTLNSYATSLDRVPIDTFWTYDYLMSKTDTPDWSKQQTMETEGVRLTFNTTSRFIKVAAALQYTRKTTACTNLLDKFLRCYPTSKIPRDAFFADIPDLYLKCGRREDGEKVAQEILNQSRNDYKQIIDNKSLPYSDWDRTIQLALYSLQQLSAFYARMDRGSTLSVSLQQEMTEKYNRYKDVKNKRVFR